MKKTPKELAVKYKKDSELIKKKSKEISEFVNEAPKLLRILNSNAEMLDYTCDELEKFNEFQPIPIEFPDYIGDDYYDLKELNKWTIPTKAEISSASMLVSGLVNDSTSSVMPVVVSYPNYNSNYYKNFPDNYKHLKFTSDLISLLDLLDSNLANIWRSVWEKLALEGQDSLKNASVNARTVVDELSWLTDYEHLTRLPWCKLDDKNVPTRAVRYAWIYYGDKLPEELNNDVTLDSHWKTLYSGYKNLGKYIHISTVDDKDKMVVESSVKSIEIALIDYLDSGFDRLQLRIREKTT